MRLAEQASKVSVSHQAPQLTGVGVQSRLRPILFPMPTPTPRHIPLSAIGSAQFKRQKIAARKIALRKQLWPDLDEARLWSRKNAKGFTTIPRTLGLFMRAMDEMAQERVSQVYFDLWCRAPDEMFLALDKPQDMAFSAGFSGERAVQSWSKRIDKLAELGFIRLADGSTGKRGHCVILSPYVVLKENRGKISRELLNTLLARAQEIGAEELDEPAEPPKGAK
jgi:hypothetical protein